MKKSNSLPLVFVIDDDEDDRFFIELALRHEPNPCRVLSAGGGQQALDLLAQLPTQPDMILLDLNMPMMTGFEVLQQLKQSSAYASIPVVILTTSGDSADQLRARQLGATDFMTKPTTYDGLNAIAERIRLVLVE